MVLFTTILLPLTFLLRFVHANDIASEQLSDQNIVVPSAVLPSGVNCIHDDLLKAKRNGYSTATTTLKTTTKTSVVTTTTTKSKSTTTTKKTTTTTPTTKTTTTKSTTTTKKTTTTPKSSTTTTTTKKSTTTTTKKTSTTTKTTSTTTTTTTTTSPPSPTCSDGKYNVTGSDGICTYDIFCGSTTVNRADKTVPGTDIFDCVKQAAGLAIETVVFELPGICRFFYRPRQEPFNPPRESPPYNATSAAAFNIDESGACYASTTPPPIDCTQLNEGSRCYYDFGCDALFTGAPDGAYADIIPSLIACLDYTSGRASVAFNYNQTSGNCSWYNHYPATGPRTYAYNCFAGLQENTTEHPACHDPLP